ncbi:MAG: hypothetical protein D6705_05195 [Deltaproteobacteria bacterium]|nr:MAG: hypothetical protein D6705_05195 [Deltaproteobacteria bacterium]
MNLRYGTIFVASLALGLAACGSDVVEGNGTDTESGTDTDAGSTSSSTGSPTTMSTSSGTSMGSDSATSTSSTSSTTGGASTGGASTGGASTGSGTTGGSTTGGASAGTTTGGMSGGSTTTGPGTTGGSQACQDVHEIVLDAEDATLTGDWELTMSMLGEGMIAFIPFNVNNPDGDVVWNVEVPCEDTWHIFVRGFDVQNEDSYFAQVDGEPNPAAIMEVDCTGDPMGMQGEYRWREMNWRAQGDGPCQYVEDPWTFDWAAQSSHDVVFSYRESRAIARIVVTNDPNWQP